jgi:hypothetical protein
MLPLTKKRRVFQIFRAAAARKDLNIAELVSKREAGKSTSQKRSRDQRASKMQCEDIPIDSSLVEAADELLKAVADATEGTGEADAFPDFEMVPLRSVQGARARRFYPEGSSFPAQAVELC